MIKDFSDAFDIGKTSGKAVKKKDYSTEGKFPVVDQGEEFIGGFTNDPSLVINSKKPVIIFGDHTRRLKYIDFPFVPGADGTKILIPKDDLIPKFAFYQLQSIDLRERGYARHFSELRKSSIWVPKSSEQEEIVDLLEEHLSRLDAALTDVKQVRIKSLKFRRSFIHEMTTSIESSEVMSILDVCDIYQPKTISTRELISDGEFPVYGANGQIGYYDKFNHEDSEVTVTCRGATCGTVNVIPPMSWITGNAMVFKPKDNRIQRGFLEYILRGMDWTPVITGTAQPQITRASIKDVYINVPSPGIQREIYLKLESSLTQVTSASLLSEKVENQGVRLRRSLLRAAFTGQLTKEVASV